MLCTRFNRYIGALDKYGLHGWKTLRHPILTLDHEQCVLCGAYKNLHIHHIETIKTNDSPETLVTLCERCHAQVHADLNRNS